jgi:hypothetical protein
MTTVAKLKRHVPESSSSPFSSIHVPQLKAGISPCFSVATHGPPHHRHHLVRVCWWYGMVVVPPYRSVHTIKYKVECWYHQHNVDLQICSNLMCNARCPVNICPVFSTTQIVTVDINSCNYKFIFICYYYLLFYFMVCSKNNNTKGLAHLGYMG